MSSIYSYIPLGAVITGTLGIGALIAFPINRVPCSRPTEDFVEMYTSMGYTMLPKDEWKTLPPRAELYDWEIYKVRDSTRRRSSRVVQNGAVRV